MRAVHMGQVISPGMSHMDAVLMRKMPGFWGYSSEVVC
jgi:hypothetical protein